MPSRDSVHYFGAGPAPLPTSILENASKVLLNYNESGVGICEISHRSSDATKILENAKSSLKELLDIPDTHEVIFLQGGGSGEFSASVYNMVSFWVEKRRARIAADLHNSGREDGSSGDDERVFKKLKADVDEHLKLDYLVTGSWSLKASQEAARLCGKGVVNVAADARKEHGGKFGTIPDAKSWNLTPRGKGKGAAMVYYCDNETVDGVEFPSFPSSLEPGAKGEDDEETLVVADMSSNFISRKVDVSKYAVIFGGAQKNVGNTGITIVIARRDILDAKNHANADLLRQLGLSVGPVVLDWPTIAKNNSLYNTLPIFDVWIAGGVMRSLLDTFGEKKIAGQEDVSKQKSDLLYGMLDKFPKVYQVVPDKSARSRMNICFRVKNGDDAEEKQFLKGAEEFGLLGLKGHRSVGGMRASNCECPFALLNFEANVEQTMLFQWTA